MYLMYVFIGVNKLHQTTQVSFFTVTKVQLFPLICAMVKSRYSGYGHPTFNGNPYNGYINP